VRPVREFHAVALSPLWRARPRAGQFWPGPRHGGTDIVSGPAGAPSGPGAGACAGTGASPSVAPYVGRPDSPALFCMVLAAPRSGVEGCRFKRANSKRLGQQRRRVGQACGTEGAHPSTTGRVKWLFKRTLEPLRDTAGCQPGRGARRGWRRCRGGWMVGRPSPIRSNHGQCIDEKRRCAKGRAV